jgi:Sulfotransferase family
VTKLVYIGGYGHSGSTLLEYLMAGSPAVLACGEVVSSIRERSSDRKEKICSCGRGAEACPVWSFYHARDGRPLRHAELLQAFVDRSDGHYAAIVDSSKTAWGSFGAPFRLRRSFGSDFVLVHLVRQPAAVSWSVLRKKIRRAKREGREPLHYTLRCGGTVAAWSLANMACELFGLLHPNQYCRLRYEDMVCDPEESLRALFDKMGPGVRWSFTEPSLRDNRHQLYGNSVKHHQLAIADVKEDLEWQTEMPPEYSRVVLALSYPLRLRYGY